MLKSDLAAAKKMFSRRLVDSSCLVGKEALLGEPMNQNCIDNALARIGSSNSTNHYCFDAMHCSTGPTRARAHFGCMFVPLWPLS